MNRTETIFFIAATILLLICVSTMLEYSFIFIFMLALAAIVIIMSLFSKYSAKHENEKLSRIFCILGVIVFAAYLINSVYADFTGNEPAIDGLLLVTLFIIAMGLGWFFEEKKIGLK